MKKTIFAIALICSIAAVSCTKDDQPENVQEKGKPYVLDTRSFSSLSSKDFRVTMEEAELYSLFMADSHGFNWVTGSNNVDQRLSCNPDKIDIKAYPSKENPDVFILNYPDYGWEILSADKRTAMVLAAGEGVFSMEDENVARVAWIKDLAEEIRVLHEYDGEIKNAEERYIIWQNVIACGAYIKWQKDNCLISFEEASTRSGAGLDTTYHPVPGHYNFIGVNSSSIVFEEVSHLTGTLWSQVAPYNQYCPMDFETHSRAKAGSDAVAGAQMVYYIHGNADACPPIYRTGYCEAYITDPMDWTAMDQFDKSADNWSLFQTSDSTRMAAVMIANIGERMMLDYGLNYTGGNFGDLQTILQSEYGLESFSLPFNGEVDPYEEIYRMAHSGLPSIVHTGYGQNNTQPHTFIVDGYRTVKTQMGGLYVFIPDDLSLSDIYQIAVAYLTPYIYETYFCMNWGNGYLDNSWYIDSSDWHINTLDYSNREALLSFRMDGSVPGEDVE